MLFSNGLRIIAASSHNRETGQDLPETIGLKGIFKSLKGYVSMLLTTDSLFFISCFSFWHLCILGSP